MTELEKSLLGAFETHSVREIRDLLDAGLDVRSPIEGKSPVNWLTEMYTRSDRFPECLRLLLDRGGELDDPTIAPVLLNDVEALTAAVIADSRVLVHRTSIVSAFTPLFGASLLHVAAEYGNEKIARVLIDMGAAVDARTLVDAHGLNGHTPLFHTVNTAYNRGASIMHLLLDAGAKPDIRLKGITWGKGFEWETTVFDVTPISYAQCGLLPQFHRGESDTYDNVRVLLERSGRSVPPLNNIPNQYLTPKSEA